MSGQFRLIVTNATRPLPIQLNGKLLNQTPFILEENKFINLSHGWSDRRLAVRVQTLVRRSP